MIYTNLFESAVQTPDDIGVDLDQVEKDIAGEDGIQAHIDDVEAAQDGMIGEPVEEFAMILFENEYNFNQIMQAVGMAELREAAMGREMVLEAVDIKGFFRKVKEFFVNMFAKITEVVRDILAKLDFQAKADKKFVTENKKAIEDGISKIKWEDFPLVYKDPLKKDIANGFQKLIDIALGKRDTEKTKIYGKITEINSTKLSNKNKDEIKKSLDILKEKIKTFDEVIWAEMTDKSPKSIAEFKEAMHEKLFGKEPEEITNSDIKAEKVISLLSNDREAKSIRETYAEFKKSINKTISNIKQWESAVSKSENSDMLITFAQLEITTVKKTYSAFNIGYSETIQAAKYKRSLYRKIAHEAVKAAEEKGKYKKKDKDDKVMHNSASLFSNINII